MTMDEITKLVDDFGRVSAAEGDADLPHSETWIESRAGLLRAVEGIVRERDETMAAGAEAVRKADALAARFQAERDAANATAQRLSGRIAAAESALAAMREAMEGLLDSMVTDHDACALCLRDLSNHASGCPVVSARHALASPPPAAMSTETEVKP